MNNQQRIEAIKDRLHSLQPSHLKINDHSDQHIGHAGAQNGQGHFHLYISSAAFKNKSRIDCHKMIYQCLNTLMKTDIHALNITIIHPPEKP